MNCETHLGAAGWLGLAILWLAIAFAVIVLVYCRIAGKVFHHRVEAGVHSFRIHFWLRLLVDTSAVSLVGMSLLPIDRVCGLSLNPALFRGFCCSMLALMLLFSIYAHRLLIEVSDDGISYRVFWSSRKISFSRIARIRVTTKVFFSYFLATDQHGKPLFHASSRMEDFPLLIELLKQRLGPSVIQYRGKLGYWFDEPPAPG